MVSVGKEVLDYFISTLYRTLQEFRTSFGKCTASAAIVVLFEDTVLPNKNIQKELMHKWHVALSPHYEAIENELMDEDETKEFLDAINTIPILENLRLHKKWKRLSEHPVSRANFIKEMRNLNGLAGLDAGISSNLKFAINDVAKSVTNDIKQGKTTLKDLDAGELGSRVMSVTSDAEISMALDNVDSLIMGVRALRTTAISNMTVNVEDESILEAFKSKTLI